MKETLKYQKSSNKPEHLDENELAQYAEYLRHETGRIPEKLIEHVESCGYCRAELMAVTDLLDTLPGELPDVAGEPASPVTGYPLSAVKGSFSVLKLLRTAAAVAAVVLLAWFIQKLLPDRLMNTPVATNTVKDSTMGAQSPIRDSANPAAGSLPAAATAIPDTIRYASAFVPDPGYENLVGAKYRSGRDPKVTGPDPAVVFAPGDTLKISWTPDPGVEYLLSILNNKADQVVEIKIGPASALAWKINLKPGLYYWKFLGNEEMWKVGRMRVVGKE